MTQNGPELTQCYCCDIIRPAGNYTCGECEQSFCLTCMLRSGARAPYFSYSMQMYMCTTCAYRYYPAINVVPQKFNVNTCCMLRTIADERKERIYQSRIARDKTKEADEQRQKKRYYKGALDIANHCSEDGIPDG